MEGTVTIVNDPRTDHPEMKKVVDEVIKSLEDLKIDGYDIRVTFIQKNRVTVDVNPVGISDDLVDLIKFLDNSSTGTLARTGMTQDYFEGYFRYLFTSKYRKAFPLDELFTESLLTMDDINRMLKEKGINYKLTYKSRAFDNTGVLYYWCVNLDKNKEE